MILCQRCSEQSSDASHQKMKVVHAVLLFAALTEAASCPFAKRYIFVDNALNWSSALTICRRNFLDLATINSEADRVNIKNPNIAQRWIGLSRSLQETNFTQWSDGSNIEFTNWTSGEPKHLNNYLCVTLYESTFAVENCSKSLLFICYKWIPQIIMVQEMMNWEDALNYYRTHYSDLVSLNANDLIAIKKTNLTNPSPSLWTGLRFMNDLWFWVDQELLGSLLSMPSCPTRLFHCGALEADSYILESRNCSDKTAFICY